MLKELEWKKTQHGGVGGFPWGRVEVWVWWGEGSLEQDVQS